VLQRQTEEFVVAAPPCPVEGQRIQPFRAFKLIGFSKANFRAHAVREQILLCVPQKSLKVLHIGGSDDTSRTLVDQNCRRKHDGITSRAREIRTHPPAAPKDGNLEQAER